MEIEFEVPNYTVPENNGSVFVCLRTNTGTAQSISIGVRASEKTTGDIATGKPVFSSYKFKSVQYQIIT